MLRPMGTPSTGSAMSVLNGQNPPHTWVLVPKNSSIVGMSPPHPPPLERRPLQDDPVGVGGMDGRRTGMSGSMVRPVFLSLSAWFRSFHESAANALGGV